MSNLVRDFIRNYPKLPPAPTTVSVQHKDLLVVSKVLEILVDGLRQRMSWLDIKGIDEGAAAYLAKLFVERIDKEVHSHPSNGKTFSI